MFYFDCSFLLRRNNHINLYNELLKIEPDIKYENLSDKLSEKSSIGIGTIKKTLREYKSTGTV